MRLETQLAENCKHNKESFQELKAGNTELKGMIKGLDKKYSAKWVEKGLVAIITAIVLGAVYAVFKSAGVELYTIL